MPTSIFFGAKNSPTCTNLPYLQALAIRRSSSQGFSKDLWPWHQGMTTVGEFHPHHPYSKEGNTGKPPRKLSKNDGTTKSQRYLSEAIARDTTKIGMFRWALPWRRRIVCTTTSSSVWIGPYFCLSKRGPLWGLPSLGERQVEERAHQNLVLADTLSPPASGEFPTHRKPQLGYIGII